MTLEVTCLTAITLFTGLLWIPYIANVVGVRGPPDALGHPENPMPVAPRAGRVDRAHRNAVENLVIFAPLVLVAYVAGAVPKRRSWPCAFSIFVRSLI